jgi:hypothetical protein
MRNLTKLLRESSIVEHAPIRKYMESSVRELGFAILDEFNEVVCKKSRFAAGDSECRGIHVNQIYQSIVLP